MYVSPLDSIDISPTADPQSAGVDESQLSTFEADTFGGLTTAVNNISTAVAASDCISADGDKVWVRYDGEECVINHKVTVWEVDIWEHVDFLVQTLDPRSGGKWRALLLSAMAPRA